MSFKRFSGSLSFVFFLLFSSSAFAENPWSMVIIPDTQYYVRNEEYAPLFTEITEWIVENRKELNIQLVLHVGDIVDANDPVQWEHAKESLHVLDGKLPYILSVGNHDLGKNSSDRSTMLNDYFLVSDNPLNKKIFGGFYKKGELENAWYLFKYGGREYVIFSLEFGPRKEVVEWANTVAAKQSDKPFILVTHEFIDHESTIFNYGGMALHTTPESKNSPYSYGISKPGPVHCGQELWDAFVSKYSNFEFVFNGHYKAFRRTGPNPGDTEAIWDALAASYRKDVYPNGNTVHQMLFNAQWAPMGGEGWIRILEFLPDGKTVRVKTFSPHLLNTGNDPATAWKHGKEMEFDLQLNKMR